MLILSRMNFIMFRDNELLTGEDETMRQKDIEKFAFLYLCGQRDKDILAGKERMTFQDFDRLTYITDFLELDQMNLEIWNCFYPQFKEQFEAVGRLLEENCRNMEFREYEDDIRLHNKWLTEFCTAAPEKEMREYLIEVIDLIHEKGRKRKTGRQHTP